MVEPSGAAARPLQAAPPCRSARVSPQRQRRAIPDAELGWLRLVVPRDNPSAPFAAEQLYTALHDATPKGAWTEIVLAGTAAEVGIWLHAPADRLEVIAAQWLSTYPDAELQPVAHPPCAPGGATASVGASWQLAGPAAFPIKTVREFTNSEPIALTLGALAEARDGELGVIRLALAPAPPSFYRKAKELAQKIATGADTSPLWLRAIGAPFDLAANVLQSALAPADPRQLASQPAQQRPPQLAADADEQLKWITGKASHLAFTVALTTGWWARTHARAQAGHAGLAAAFGQFAVPGQNALRPAKMLTGGNLAGALAGPPPRRRARLILGVSELAGLVHLPGPDLVIPRLARTGARSRALAHPKPNGGITLGASTHRTGGQPVGLRPADLLRHAYVLGPSGVGKTVLLTNLVLGLAATNTAAVVLDPHGDLTRQLLARLPGEAAQRTRLLDLTDPANLPTINPLWLPEQDDPAKAALARSVRSAAVTACFTDLWGLGKATTPNLLHFLEAALAALVGSGSGCLADLPRFLTDGAFRAQVVRAAGDPRIAARWAEFAQLGPDDRSRTVRAILNKAADFDRNPLLATVFGDPGPGLRLEQTMDHRGLLIVNLPRGLVPEGTAELVGSLLVTMLYQTALAREARPEARRPPVVAVIDEFQEFALHSFAKIVTATRKYGLGLVVANQNLSRLRALNPDVLSTLLANAATLGAFRLGPADANVIAPMLDPYDADDLTALAPYECYWRLPGPGGAIHTAATRTLPLPDSIRDNDEAADLAGRIRLGGRALELRRTAPTGAGSAAEAAADDDW
jgi:hypothetical protein